VRWVTLFFMTTLALFIALSRDHHLIAVIYFVWIGIFSAMAIGQLWGFAADLYTPEEGKRLFPLIGLGSSLGAWIGSAQAGRIIVAFGPYTLMGIGAD
jgi:AAA family ATP:ADP antiporter